MKIECPNCQHEGNVSEDKIPASGVTATCPKCKHKFSVSREESEPHVTGEINKIPHVNLSDAVNPPGPEQKDTKRLQHYIVMGLLSVIAVTTFITGAQNIEPLFALPFLFWFIIGTIGLIKKWNIFASWLGAILSILLLFVFMHQPQETAHTKNAVASTSTSNSNQPKQNTPEVKPLQQIPTQTSRADNMQFINIAEIEADRKKRRERLDKRDDALFPITRSKFIDKYGKDIDACGKTYYSDLDSIESSKIKLESTKAAITKVEDLEYYYTTLRLNLLLSENDDTLHELQSILFAIKIGTDKSNKTCGLLGLQKLEYKFVEHIKHLECKANPACSEKLDIQAKNNDRRWKDCFDGCTKIYSKKPGTKDYDDCMHACTN